MSMNINLHIRPVSKKTVTLYLDSHAKYFKCCLITYLPEIDNAVLMPILFICIFDDIGITTKEKGMIHWYQFQVLNIESFESTRSIIRHKSNSFATTLSQGVEFPSMQTARVKILFRDASCKYIEQHPKLILHI